MTPKTNPRDATAADPLPPVVFILGAGRSGTNMLTFAFNAESLDFLDLGENRYVWSYRSRTARSDRRSAADATPEIAAYLRRHLHMRLSRHPDRAAAVLLDKTPSNAFRIPLIAAILPEARFIHIIRDGRDNILSRTRQWKNQQPEARQDSVPMAALPGKLHYLQSRLGHFRKLLRSGALPPDRIPRMLRESLGAQIFHLLTGRPAHYGERIPGLPDVLRLEGLDAAAAVQWRESVLSACMDGAALGHAQYLELRFETFIADPVTQWHRVMAFLDRAPTGAGDAWLRAHIKPRNTGKWLDPAESTRIQALERHLRPTLEHLGYPWDLPAP